MAESCTITEETLGTVKKIKWVWVSAADGTVGAVVFDTANAMVAVLATGHATNMAKLL